MELPETSFIRFRLEIFSWTNRIIVEDHFATTIVKHGGIFNWIMLLSSLFQSITTPMQFKRLIKVLPKLKTKHSESSDLCQAAHFSTDCELEPELILRWNGIPSAGVCHQISLILALVKKSLIQRIKGGCLTQK